jgi:hypothetical protein
MAMNLIFPEVFITGILPIPSDERKVCTDALIGWANCMAGATPPTLFGEGIAAIGQRLGIIPVSSEIEKYAIEKGYLKAEK